MIPLEIFQMDFCKNDLIIKNSFGKTANLFLFPAIINCSRAHTCLSAVRYISAYSLQNTDLTDLHRKVSHLRELQSRGDPRRWREGLFHNCSTCRRESDVRSWQSKTDLICISYLRQYWSFTILLFRLPSVASLDLNINKQLINI